MAGTDLTRPREKGVTYTEGPEPQTDATSESTYTYAERTYEARTYKVATRPYRLEEDGLDFDKSQAQVTRATKESLYAV